MVHAHADPAGFRGHISDSVRKSLAQSWVGEIIHLQLLRLLRRTPLSTRDPVLLHQLFLQIDRDDWLSGPLKLLPPGADVLELRVPVGGLPTPQRRALRL